MYFSYLARLCKQSLLAHLVKLLLFLSTLFPGNHLVPPHLSDDWMIWSKPDLLSLWGHLNSTTIREPLQWHIWYDSSWTLTCSCCHGASSNQSPPTLAQSIKAIPRDLWAAMDTLLFSQRPGSPWHFCPLGIKDIWTHLDTNDLELISLYGWKPEIIPNLEPHLLDTIKNWKKCNRTTERLKILVVVEVKTTTRISSSQSKRERLIWQMKIRGFYLHVIGLLHNTSKVKPIPLIMEKLNLY